MPMATIEGTTVPALKRSPPDQICKRERGAGEERGQADDGQREVADAQELLAELDRVEGRADELGDARATAKSVSRPVAPRSPRVERPIEARKAWTRRRRIMRASGRRRGRPCRRVRSGRQGW